MTTVQMSQVAKCAAGLETLDVGFEEDCEPEERAPVDEGVPDVFKSEGFSMALKVW